MRRWLALLLLMCLAGVAWAHETLPAALTLLERDPGRWDIVLRIPATQGIPPPLQPRLPAHCVALPAAAERQLPAARQLQWQGVACSLGPGDKVAVDGLAATQIDLLLRVVPADGRVLSQLLRPRTPAWMLPARAQAAPPARAYFGLGVEHILGGTDHLLFVLSLLLLVRRALPLLRTVTAFTLAHSLTLAAAALGWVQVPGAPVEAAIALSIVFVARELLRPAPGLAARRPWLVALTFGLLHGLGFAGALAELGLPAGEIPLALALFNLGVEAGQLLFLAAVLLAWLLLMRARKTWPRWAARVPAYVLGAVSSCWLLQRLALL
ncbi:HupE/UreJ family protein [Paucibacter soli]|uniref:HupE/UreJ family protein n=1 Tax=Paucibacter soli TaxID=3133433 RepID=UPI0030AE6E88